VDFQAKSVAIKYVTFAAQPAIFMGSVTVRDKEFSLFLSPQQIQDRVRELAKSVNQDFDKQVPIFLPVLNGAFMFAADLLRAVSITCEVSFVKLASYEGMESTGKVRSLIGLGEELRGRHIVLVEDIVDTGNTLKYLLENLKIYEPASVRVATLLFKKEAYLQSIALDYVGFEVPNRFLLGYGLDYDGWGRNLDGIFELAVG